MNNELTRFLVAEIECLKDELAHWSDEEVITFGNLWAENIYEVSSFQAPSRDGWLNTLALSDTLSYPVEKCLKLSMAMAYLK